MDGKNIYNKNAWEAGDAAYNFVDNWLEDQKWHYYTAVFTDTNAKVFLDGEVKNEWNVDGVTEGPGYQRPVHQRCRPEVCVPGRQPGLGLERQRRSRSASHVCSSRTSKMTAGEIKAQMLADFPGYEEYQKSEPVIDAIQSVAAAKAEGKAYNLAGQQVNDSFKGVDINNGRLYLK